MGKLIVIEGIDGSGKSTQFQLLTERLEREARAFQTVRFPRYDRDSSVLVRQYLAGDFGTKPNDVNAYAASAFFAVDRFASYKTEPWGAYYDADGAVLTDRYTTSNAIHQGAKMQPKQREKFFRWLDNFEFTEMKLPRPDVVIYLKITAAQSLDRIHNREGVEDIHERDGEYLKNCADCADSAAEVLGWTTINAMQSVEEIHEEIYKTVRRLFE